MSPQIITMFILILMLIAIWKLNFYRIIFKGIEFEDRMYFNLDEPLYIKEYKKLFTNEFKPYIMEMSTDINEYIFDKFLKIDNALHLLEYKQLSHFHIIFINKIDGYMYRESDKSYEFFVKDDFIPFVTKDKEKTEIFDKMMDQKYNVIEEFDIDGTIILNKKRYFLRNLTSISNYRNTVGRKEYSELVFNFGKTTESVRFKSFKEAFDYLFKNDLSDVRLIQKIANTSFINIKKGVN